MERRLICYGVIDGDGQKTNNEWYIVSQSQTPRGS